MTLEQKIAYLATLDPKKRAEQLAKWASEDAAMHYAVNANKISMDDFMKQDQFKTDASNNREFRKNLKDRGFTKDGTMKLIGQIPYEIYMKRKEFSHSLPRKERDANIRKFLNDYPDFKV